MLKSINKLYNRYILLIFAISNKNKSIMDKEKEDFLNEITTDIQLISALKASLKKNIIDIMNNIRLCGISLVLEDYGDYDKFFRVLEEAKDGTFVSNEYPLGFLAVTRDNEVVLTCTRIRENYDNTPSTREVVERDIIKKEWYNIDELNVEDIANIACIIYKIAYNN